MTIIHSKKYFVSFITLLFFSLPFQKLKAQQNVEVAALGAGMAALLIGSSLVEEDIIEQLEASALDYLLSQGETGAVNIQLVQRKLYNGKSLRDQGSQGRVFTFLVTNFQPSTQLIKEKRVLMLLIRDRLYNEFGLTYKPYMWITFGLKDWIDLVSESVKTMGPFQTIDAKDYLYMKSSSSNADYELVQLGGKIENGNVGEISIKDQIARNNFDGIRQENLTYDITGDSYIIRQLTVDQEELSIFYNEKFIGLYSSTLGCHSLLKLQDLTYINSFIFD